MVVLPALYWLFAARGRSAGRALMPEPPALAGVARLLTGLARRTRDDGERIERGGQLFEDLYESFPRRGSGLR